MDTSGYQVDSITGIGRFGGYIVDMQVVASMALDCNHGEDSWILFVQAKP